MYGLGNEFNITTSATTAKVKVNMKNAGGVTFALIGATSGDATVNYYDSAGANETALAIITEYWRQNNGVWTRVTQSAAATFTAGTGGLAVCEIDADQLPDAAQYLAATHASGSFLVLTRSLHSMRYPSNLPDIRA